MSKHRPLRDACDTYVKACESDSRLLSGPSQRYRLRSGVALADLLGDVQVPSMTAARAIRDAINAAWDAGYEEGIDDAMNK